MQSHDPRVRVRGHPVGPRAIHGCLLRLGLRLAVGAAMRIRWLLVLACLGSIACGSSQSNSESNERDCVVAGERVPHGSQWKADCNVCTCENGQTGCTNAFCSDCQDGAANYFIGDTWGTEGGCACSCVSDPETGESKAECCQRCEGRPDGMLVSDLLSCNVCTCEAGAISACTERDCGLPCRIEQSVYPDGSVFQDEAGTQYGCENGDVVPREVRADACVVDGMLYQDGEHFDDHGSCNRCRCEAGTPVCETDVQCPSCWRDGRRYPNGARWTDGDVTYVCDEGRVDAEF